MKKQPIKKQLSLTTGIAAAMAAGFAQAQSIEEIIVTAQKRSENVQEVPIAITGFSANALEEGRIQSTQDLQFHVPSLNFGYLSVFSKVYLRGIGTDITAQGADGAVATYLDGVYIPGQSSQIQGLLGTERIEVLAGPQGTLYGRNAVAGAINMYSLTPSQEADAKLTLGTGNYGRREVTGHVSGGVTDTLSLGLYGGYIKRDTFVDIVNVDVPYYGFQNDMHEAVDHELQWGTRVKGVWEPNEKLKVTASWDYSEVEGVEGGIFRNTQANSLAYGFEPYQQVNGTGSIFQFVPGYEAGIQEYLPNVPRMEPGVIEEYRYETNLPSYSVQTQTMTIVRVDYEMDNGMQFVSLSSYNDHIGQGADDVDGTAAPVYGSTSRDWGQIDITTSQEFQLLAPADAKYQWIVGLYYLDQDSNFSPNDAYGLAAAGFFGANLLDYRFTNYGYGNTKSYAVYGQTTVPLDDFVEGLQLTVGLRYTLDEKKWLDSRTETESPAGAVITNVFPTDETDWNDVTPKLTLDYKRNNTMYYFTYAEGYRAGMYNLSGPQEILARGAVDPEQLTDFEIGTKSDFMDGRVRLNTSLWFYEFEDIQVNRVDTGGGAGSGIAASIQNAAEAEVLGAEVTLNFAATDNLTLNLGTTYLDSEFTSFPDAAAIDINTSPFYAPNGAVVVDASGNDLVRSPDLVVNGSIDYRIPMKDGGELQFNLAGYYNDGYFFNTTNDLEQPSYSLFDGFIRYAFAGDKYAIKLWGKNLTDEFYHNELQNLLSIISQDGMRRHWGLTFTYNL